MIKVIDDLTGSPCPWCGEPIGPGFSLQEVAPDVWVVVCVPCELATEASEGK